MNTKMAEFYKRYCSSDATDIFDVYGRCCEKNRNSWKRIKEQAKNLGAEEVRILSHSSHHYTCGYVYTHPETGVLTFRVETRLHTYECAL